MYRRRGNRKGNWPGNGPFSNLPPWERAGWVYGTGGVVGSGYTNDPTRCSRFPWLSRWWWANPDNTQSIHLNQDIEAEVSSQQPVYPNNIEVPAVEEEKRYLKEMIDSLETQLQQLRKRLGNLE